MGRGRRRQLQRQLREHDLEYAVNSLFKIFLIKYPRETLEEGFTSAQGRIYFC
jgi:hypothetical protein